MKGCMGYILEVDLSSRSITKKKVPDEVYEKVLSGKGLGAWYLFRNIPAGADPLGPDNILGFASGALTGTGALITGRWVAVAKSPLTGGWGDASCGGNFSPAMKQCGVDAIFFKGVSENSVYLYMDNKTCELRDASAYWGMDAIDAEQKLVADNWVKKKPCVVTIGQAGEKVSLISGICNDGGRISARSGVGAVMGSKKLKAVVLAGSKAISGSNPERIRELNKKLGKTLKGANLPDIVKGRMLSYAGLLMGKLPNTVVMDGSMMAPIFVRWGSCGNNGLAMTWGDSPVKNWSSSYKDAKSVLKTQDPDKVIQYETSKYHCYSCGIGCGGKVDMRSVRNGEFNHSHKPEYETFSAFGSLLLNDDLGSVFYINELVNRAGMDSISAGNTIAWAIECYVKGLLSKEQTDGLELTWGNVEAIIALVKKMIAREGFGDKLADGVKCASKYYGTQTQQYAMHVGGQEPGMHDSRLDPQLAIHYAAEPAPGKHTVGSGMMYNAMSLADICSWAPPAKNHMKSHDLVPNEEIALISKANACYTMVSDSAGGCYYGAMLGVHLWNVIEYLNAAAGWEYDGDHYMEIGARIQTIRQLFNIKHGIKPAEVKLSDRMMGRPPLKAGPLKGVTLQTEQQVSDLWRVFGWNKDTGEPMAETLQVLGIPALLKLKEE